MNITLNLTLEETQAVLDKVAEGSIKQFADLFFKIRGQAVEQQAAANRAAEIADNPLPSND